MRAVLGPTLVRRFSESRRQLADPTAEVSVKMCLRVEPEPPEGPVNAQGDAQVRKGQLTYVYVFAASVRVSAAGRGCEAMGDDR